jgi:hypothetical protein
MKRRSFLIGTGVAAGVGLGLYKVVDFLRESGAGIR